MPLCSRCQGKWFTLQKLQCHKKGIIAQFQMAWVCSNQNDCRSLSVSGAKWRESMQGAINPWPPPQAPQPGDGLFRHRSRCILYPRTCLAMEKDCIVEVHLLNSMNFNGIKIIPIINHMKPKTMSFKVSNISCRMIECGMLSTKPEGRWPSLPPLPSHEDGRFAVGTPRLDIALKLRDVRHERIQHQAMVNSQDSVETKKH